MDLRMLTALAAVMLGISIAASAGVNTWSAIGPNGGEVRKVVYNRHTPGVVYMIAEAGFLRSLDDGATWHLVKNDFFNPPSDLDVDPTDNNRVYLASGGQWAIEVSTDAGATFSPMTSFPNVGNAFQLEVSTDGGTLYAVHGLRVFRSQDRGATWQERTALGAQLGLITRLLVDPTDKETVYAIAPTLFDPTTVFVTRDGGATWTQPSTADVGGDLFDIAISASNPERIWLAAQDGVYVSSDSGAHFSLNFGPPSLDGVQTIVINPVDSMNLFVAGPFGHLFRTDNEGATWVDVTGDSTSASARTIAFQPAQPSTHVLVGGFGGLSQSTVGGMTWTPRNTGFFGTRISALSGLPDGRVYLSALGAGAHYIAANESSTTPVDNAQLRKLAASPTSFIVPNILAQGGTPDRLFASLDTGLARSLDGGSNWELTTLPRQPGIGVRKLASSPGNPQVILASTSRPLYRSTDGGDSWNPITEGLPPNSFIEAMEFGISEPLVAYAGPNSLSGPARTYGIYRSTNAGQSWSAANTGIEHVAVRAIAVDPADAQTLYVSGNDAKLWKSTNGGSSWTELPWPWLLWGFPSALAVEPVHPNILYVAGPSVVARSIDRGETWELLREEQRPSWVPDTLLPHPLRPHELLVGTVNSSVQQITIAPDLELKLNAPSDPVSVGLETTYRYTVSNLGPFHATGVTLALEVPANAQRVSVSATVGTCTAPGPTMTCSIDAARAGSTATVSVRVTPAATGPFQVSASVHSHQPDASMANNSASVSTNVTAAPPSPQPPASNGGGGGGSLSRYCLLLLGLILARQLLQKAAERNGRRIPCKTTSLRRHALSAAAGSPSAAC